ncbi:MAG: hypothetical protein JWM83_1931 [Candidatus Angelobacter sp.]|nr:hypothetical protein [Candidatus Angelobacter sp.]
MERDWSPVVIKLNKTESPIGIVLFLLIAVASTHGIGQDFVPIDPAGTKLLDAVQSALVNHPLLKAQEAQVDIDRGAIKLSAGIFDTELQSDVNHTLTTNALLPSTGTAATSGADTLSSSHITRTQTSFASTRLLRNGVSVAELFQINRNVDNVLNLTGLNTSTVSLQFSIPLMRGRGKKAVAAQEIAAKRELDSGLYELNQLASQLMANVATSYWNLVAARKVLAISRAAEDRGKAMQESIQILIDADQVPRNDLNEVKANFAQRSSARFVAEQAVTAAQQQLALDMGISARDLTGRRLEPATDFPATDAQALPANDSEALQYYLTEALQRRGDYLAARSRIDESRALLAGARSKLLPQFDLKITAGYAGLNPGRQFQNLISSIYGQTLGPNAGAGFTYSFPVHNQAAEGAAIQTGAQIRQAELQAEQVTRLISSSIVVAVEGVRASSLRLERSRLSVESFQSSLNGEREKYRVGMGSIVDILALEDKLTSAMVDEVQAGLADALALTQFRFATGTIISPNEPFHSVPESVFTTLPFNSVGWRSKQGWQVSYGK